MLHSVPLRQDSLSMTFPLGGAVSCLHSSRISRETGHAQVRIRLPLATLEEVFLNLSRAELQHELALDQAAQSAAI